MDIFENYGGRFIFAAGGVGLALLVLIGILWLIRNRAPSPFVRGGKNRQPRLQVLDAAAVDARRRLVLVRRDGVEHLIMIGGPTDIVIESGIGDLSKAAAAAQPLSMEQPLMASPRAIDRLEPVREQPKTIVRQPELDTEKPAPLTTSSRAAAEPVAAPIIERREAPRPAPPAAPIVATPQVKPSAAAAPVLPSAPERMQPVAIAPAAIAAMTPEPAVAPIIAPERREVTDAVDILEAARQRVLPPQASQPQKIREKEPSPLAPPITPILAQDAYREATFESPDLIEAVAPAPAKQLGSDFESILEQEMSNNLTAERVILPAPTASNPVAPEKHEPEAAATRTSEALLQDEVARIFGDIDVKR